MNRALRSVPVLCNDDVGLVLGGLELQRPALMAVVEGIILLADALQGLFLGEVLFVPEDEQDDIGVLIDRTAVGQIGEHGALVLALLDLA